MMCTIPQTQTYFVTIKFIDPSSRYFSIDALAEDVAQVFGQRGLLSVMMGIVTFEVEVESAHLDLAFNEVAEKIKNTAFHKKYATQVIPGRLLTSKEVEDYFSYGIEGYQYHVPNYGSSDFKLYSSEYIKAYVMGGMGALSNLPGNPLAEALAPIKASMAKDPGLREALFNRIAHSVGAAGYTKETAQRVADSIMIDIFD